MAILGIKEDFTVNDLVLDAELSAIPTSGLWLNSGVDTRITLENLLAFLPFPEITFVAYSDATTYGNYSLTQKRTDIVTHGGKLWQSIQGSNLNNTPSSNSLFWMETNVESLKLKMFIEKVKDRVYTDLNFLKRIINNQYIYEVGENTVQLEGDYVAWVFEPRGSDYVSITINQISLQKAGTTPIDLYVVNQGVLVDTLSITPSDGKVEFKDVNYTFKGHGRWIFAIEATDVISKRGVVDPLSYDGFVCYTAVGYGASAQSSTWNYGNIGNGLGFNVSAELDSTLYIENNLSKIAGFVRATFELMTMEMFLANAHNRSNRAERIQFDKDALIAETKSLDMNTAAKRYYDQKKIALKAIEKTFDTQLFMDEDGGIEIGSI